MFSLLLFDVTLFQVVQHYMTEKQLFFLLPVPVLPSSGYLQ